MCFQVAAAAEHQLPYEEELCGTQAPSLFDMREKIVRPRVRPKVRAEWEAHAITAQLVQLFTRCWHHEPTNRLSASAFAMRLESISAQLHQESSGWPLSAYVPPTAHSQLQCSPDASGSASASKWCDSNGSRSFGSTSDSSHTTTTLPPQQQSGNMQSIHTLSAQHRLNLAAAAHSSVSQSQSSDTTIMPPSTSNAPPAPPAVPITSALFAQIRELLLQYHVPVPPDTRELALASAEQQSLALRLVCIAPENAASPQSNAAAVAVTGLRPPGASIALPLLPEQQQHMHQAASSGLSSSVETLPSRFTSAGSTPTRQLNAVQRATKTPRNDPTASVDVAIELQPVFKATAHADADADAIAGLGARLLGASQDAPAAGGRALGSGAQNVSSGDSRAASRGGSASRALEQPSSSASRAAAGEHYPLIGGGGGSELQSDEP